MARQKNVIVEFEAKLGRMLKAFDAVDRALKGQLRTIGTVEKANMRLTSMYEKQARALNQINTNTRRNSTDTTKVAKAAKTIREETEKTITAQKRLSSAELTALQRRINQAQGGSGRGKSMFVPLSRHGKPLTGAAREERVVRVARQLNVPTDNLGLYGGALDSARQRDYNNRVSKRSAAQQRLDRIRTGQSRRQAADAAAQQREAQRVRREASEAAIQRMNDRARRRSEAEVRLRGMKTRKFFGLRSDGTAGGFLGAVAGTGGGRGRGGRGGDGGGPSLLGPGGGLSGRAALSLGGKAAGRGALAIGGGVLGGAVGGAAAAIGGPMALAAMLTAGLGSVIKRAAEEGVRLGFSQAFKLTGIGEGFAQIMGNEGFNPVAYTDMMLKSKQELLTGTQSRTEADRLFKYVSEISKKTPFDVQQYTHAAAVGARYNVDLSKSYGTDKDYSIGKALGDLASGNNKGLEDSVFTFLHEYIATGDARSLKYRFSITPEQMMNVAKSQGFTGGNASVTDRAAMVSDFAKGQYGGSMDRQAATLTGKIADIRDSFILLQDAMGQTSAYMKAVNFFDKIKTAMERMTDVNPETGLSQLDKFSSMFNQITDKLYEWVITPIMDGLTELFAADSLGEAKKILAVGMYELLTSAIKMGLVMAWEGLKGLVITGPIGRAQKVMANTWEERYTGIGGEKGQLERATRVSTFGETGVANSSNLDFLTSRGMSVEAMRNLGMIETRDVPGSTGLFGQLEPKREDYLSSPEALTDIVGTMRESGLSVDQVGKAAAYVPTITQQMAALAEAQKPIQSKTDWNKLTPEEQAAAVEKQRQAATALNSTVTGMMGSTIGDSATKEQREGLVKIIEDAVKASSTDNEFTQKFGLLVGSLMGVGPTAEDRSRNTARTEFENSAKQNLQQLEKIYGAILSLKDAIVNVMVKAHDLIADQQSLDDKLGALRGESPHLQQKRRTGQAFAKARDVAATNAVHPDLVTNSALDSEIAAWDQAAESALASLPNSDPYSPGAEGSNPMARQQAMRDAQYARDMAAKGRRERNERLRMEQSFHISDLRFSQQYMGQKEGEMFGTGDGENKGVLHDIFSGLLVGSGTPGASTRLGEKEIQNRIGAFREVFEQNKLRQKLGIEQRFPSELIDKVGGGTIMVDAAGRAVGEKELTDMSEEERAKLHTVSAAGFLEAQLADQFDPKNAVQYDLKNKADAQINELKTGNGILGQINEKLTLIINGRNGNANGEPSGAAPKTDAKSGANLGTGNNWRDGIPEVAGR